MRIKINIHPSGGWFFIEKDGTKIKGGSFKGALKKIIHYRRLNKFPPGEPEAEFISQMCARHPDLCYNERSSWTPPKIPEPSLKSRVLSWLGKLSRVTPAFVKTEVAGSRAETCLRCPKSGPMEKGCSTCRTAVEELRKSILRGRKPDRRLLSCSVLGVDLQVAVHIADDRLNDQELPGGCWRKAQ